MTNAQPEPSMEEILASIRRIISEDEEDTTSAESHESTGAPTMDLEPQALETVEEVSVVTLEPQSDIVDEPLAEISEPEEAYEPEIEEMSVQDEDVADPRLNTEDVEMIKTEVRDTIERETPMIGEASASAATKAFQNLSQTVRVSGGEGHTLEDIVMELLRPMLKDWLDQNLAAIVEEKVEEEVQRVARRGR